jgi:hypothetical protein
MIELDTHRTLDDPFISSTSAKTCGNSTMAFTWSTCGELCTISVFAGILFAWIAGSVAYLVFGILFLVQDYSAANDCKQSNLWTVVLILLIMNVPVYSCCSCDRSCFNIKAAACYCVCIVIVDGIFAVLLGVELYDGNMCDKLSHTNLHTYAEVMFVLCLTFSGLAILFLVVLMCVACCHNDDPNDHGRNTTVTTLAVAEVDESPPMIMVESEMTPPV